MKNEINLTFKDHNGDVKNDLLDINNFYSFFQETIFNTNYNVYGFTGGWGIGKSTFINMFENNLEDDDYIHIDAFKKDYESEPFIILTSAFLEFMKKRNSKPEIINEYLKNSKKFFISTAKATGKATLSFIANKTIGVEEGKEYVNDIYEAIFDDILFKKKSEETPHEQLIKTISKISNSLNKPCYIIVDELDRCRPSFALEFLEKIKHIFLTENIKFILVYNSEILESIIEKEYGLKSGGRKYLNKFIEKEIVYEYQEQIQKWFINEIDNKNEQFKMVEFSDYLLQIKSKMLMIKYREAISLRDFSRIISNVKKYKNINDYKEFTGLVSLEFFKHIDYNKFSQCITYFAKNGKFADNVPEISIYLQYYRLLLSEKEFDQNTAKEIFYNYLKRNYD